MKVPKNYFLSYQNRSLKAPRPYTVRKNRSELVSDQGSHVWALHQFEVSFFDLIAIYFVST